MNVLVIAPDSTLANAREEVSELIRTLKAVPLAGTVTGRDVLTMIGSRPWDVIWFAAHGDEQGVILSAGERLSTSAITQDVANSGARLVVLNTCESELVAYRLHEETGVDVICTVTKIDDRVAYRTGVYLARNLAAGFPAGEAYERSKPGQNKDYLYLSDGTQAMPETAAEMRQQARDIADLSRTLAVLAASYERMAQDIAEIKEQQRHQPAGYSLLVAGIVIANVSGITGLAVSISHWLATGG